MAVSVRTAPRTRNPGAKQDAIHEAALALFSDRGFEGVTVADIARKAQVAVGTVYRLYPNKHALLQTLHLTLERQFVDQMHRGWNTGKPTKDRFDDLCTALFDLIEDERTQLTILAMTTDVVFADGSLPGDVVRAEIASMIAEGIAQGTFHDEDPALLAAIVHGMVEGAMRAWLRQPTPSHRGRTVARLAQMLRDAMVRRDGPSSLPTA